MGFGKSFDEAFKTGAQSGAATTAMLIQEKLKKDTEKAEKAQRLVDIQKTALSLNERIKQAGGDPKTADIFAEGISQISDPDIAEKILTAGLTTFTAQMKDKEDFQQTMQTERYKSGMLGVTEVIKALAERGGSFADGTPITPESLQDFGQRASDRILQMTAGQGQKMIEQAQPSVSAKSTEQSIIEKSEKAKSDELLGTPIKSKASFKAEEKAAIEQAQTEKISKATFRFMQQFKRSYDELKKFDPEIDKVGFGGFMSRSAARLAEKVSELPETSALNIQIKPMAQEIASELEGGRITDQDRQIQADRFANAVKNPSPTNVRLMANGYIDLIDKGGNDRGVITKQLKTLADSRVDIFNNVIGQILTEYPELAKDIYGEDFEVTE